MICLVSGVALLRLPRRWAALPLLLGACYTTLGQGIELGPFSFSVIRILIAIGLVRIIIRQERVAGDQINALDRVVMAWALWMLFTSIFHENVIDAFIYRMGIVYNVCGIYYLLRSLCQSMGDIYHLAGMIAIILMPVAAEMVYERLAEHNLFSVFGGVAEVPAMREGTPRAQGPFAHSILAGSVGAACIPFMVGLWKEHRRRALAGLAACVVMVVASESSGPIMSAVGAVVALLSWHYRDKMKMVRWIAVIAYIGLEIVMKAPAYNIIWRFNPAGGTGWHRTALIESSINHLSEWWFAGTDYTRHWMPTGVSWSESHTDITNYYLYMGVIAGLPLMALLIVKMTIAFSFIGKSLHLCAMSADHRKFVIWTYGAALFVHAVTCVAVSYYDQSYIFLYLTFAVIGSTYSALQKESRGVESNVGIVAQVSKTMTYLRRA